jgi:hypothetical protein
MKRYLPPVHPGEILREDFLQPLGITHRSRLPSSPPARAPGSRWW